jgi:hypothetical protein
MIFAQSIIVIGLPGSGKTTFANKLLDLLGGQDTVDYYNADKVREMHNDWDFSPEGRMRQAKRMREYADAAIANGRHVICDFVCPTHEIQDMFKYDTIVFMDTIKEGRFEDTNKMFQKPKHFTWWFESWEESDKGVVEIAYEIKKDEFDYKKPTVQMLGRYQPFHDGHKALFEEALKKTGQVAIMVRSMPPSDNNPFSHVEVENGIIYKLKDYLGKFAIIAVPNIVDISYGRDVGYTISKIELPEHITSISATKIRKEMGLPGTGQ